MSDVLLSYRSRLIREPDVVFLRELEFCDTSPIEGSMASLGALEIRLVRRAEGEAVFNYLLSQQHRGVKWLTLRVLGSTGAG